MPSRWSCLLILVAWVGCTGWLFWSEILPEFGPQEPPPYTIDLVDEAQTKRPKLRWKVLQGNEEKETRFLAETWVEYREKPDDSFALLSRFRPQFGDGRLDLGLIQLHTMNTSYWVNRQGQLQEVRASYFFDIKGIGATIPNCHAELTGEIREQLFYAHFRVEGGGLLEERNLEPVAVSRSGSMVLPMHPVNRIKGLRKGQSWRMPLINPFADALGQLISFGGKGRKTVTARVLDETRTLPGNPDLPCLIVEYEDDGVPHRTWVSEEDGKVLRQEGGILGTRLILQRDNLIRFPG